MKIVSTEVLDIAYLETGPPDGAPVVLLHGFPYDVRSYAEVAPPGARVLVPYLRGYGPTRFRSPDTLRSAPSLHNPDFVDVVVHSYRHRYGGVPGDPRYAAMEERLARRPPITVPAVSLAPDSDGFVVNTPDDGRERFTGPFRSRLLTSVGHNPPQEQPASFEAAISSLLSGEAPGGI